MLLLFFDREIDYRANQPLVFLLLWCGWHILVVTDWNSVGSSNFLICEADTCCRDIAVLRTYIRIEQVTFRHVAVITN